MTVDVHTSVLGLLEAPLAARGIVEVGFRRIRVLDEARLREEPGGEDTADRSRRTAAAGAHDGAPRLGGVA